MIDSVYITIKHGRMKVILWRKTYISMFWLRLFYFSNPSFFLLQSLTFSLLTRIFFFSWLARKDMNRIRITSIFFFPFFFNTSRYDFYSSGCKNYRNKNFHVYRKNYNFSIQWDCVFRKRCRKYKIR